MSHTHINKYAYTYRLDVRCSTGRICSAKSRCSRTSLGRFTLVLNFFTASLKHTLQNNLAFQSTELYIDNIYIDNQACVMVQWQDKLFYNYSRKHMTFTTFYKAANRFPGQRRVRSVMPFQILISKALSDSPICMPFTRFCKCYNWTHLLCIKSTKFTSDGTTWQ